MNEDSLADDSLPFLFSPAIKHDLLHTEIGVNPERESRRIDRVEKAIKQIGVLTYTRLSELVVTGFLTATEIGFDASRYPEHYKGFGVTPENAPYSDASPEMLQGFDAMGDIFEISIGSGLVRVPLAVVEVMLKTEPVKMVVRKVMEYEGIKKAVRKIIGTSKTEELSTSGEIKISDDTQFLWSLLPWTLLKMAHSLGLVAFGANDHIGAPVYPRLIGHAFAVTSLMAAHYGTKNAHEIIDVTKDIFTKTRRLTSDVAQNIAMSSRQAWKTVSDTDARFKASVSNLGHEYNEWMIKMRQLDFDKVIPTHEQIYKTILGERVWSALIKLGIEHETDQEE